MCFKLISCRSLFLLLILSFCIETNRFFTLPLRFLSRTVMVLRRRQASSPRLCKYQYLCAGLDGGFGAQMAQSGTIKQDLV